MNKEKIINFYKKTNNFLKENVILVMVVAVCVLKTNFKNVPIARFMGNARANFAAKAYTADVAVESNSSVRRVGLGVTNDKKIVKNTNLSLEVNNTDNYRKKLEEEVKKNKGFIENFYSYDFYNKSALNFTIKVPSIKLDEFLNTIKKYGYVKNESFSIVDKTESYNDNENKLTNLYTRRSSLRKMMQTKSANLADILAIDKELNSVQFEIENIEKRNQEIDKEVKYSRVDLTLLPEVVFENYAEKWKFNKSFMAAVNKLIKVLHLCANAIMTLLVFTPIFALIYGIFYILKKRKK